MSEEQEIIPIEQQTIIFYDKPLIVVRLPDGRPGVVIRFFCDNLQLDTNGQVQRIRRSEAIADDLVYALIETDGGSQRMAVLVLHAVPFWLAGIDPKRVREEIRPEILRYQREVVDVLYAWAQSPKAIAAPAGLVPSEPITEPARPAADASVDEWIEYHQQMLAVLEWRRDIEHWQESIESRVEGLEAITRLIPEILERLPIETLTPQHQNKVKYYVEQLAAATGKHRGTIYSSLYMAFNVPRYQAIPQSDWGQVENWFKVQLEQKRKQ